MNRIKYLRNERGLSTRDLANILGLAPMSVNYYENEKRDMSTDTLIKIAKFFEVTCDYVLCASTYSLFLLYEKSHLFIRINENDYNVIKNKNVIYFNDTYNRCIDFNKLVNVRDDVDLSFMIVESVRNKKIDLLFDESSSKNESILLENLNTITDNDIVVDFEYIDINGIITFFKK